MNINARNTFKNCAKMYIKKIRPKDEHEQEA